MSLMVAANRLECSKTQLGVTNPKCKQNSSKHFILLADFGKNISMRNLEVEMV
jgi:hypothetical protein